jgi:FMN phosphatase YigB (HAD superfamily)
MANLARLHKPAPESLKIALRLPKLRPAECVMVAAHANDVRGGMKTVYVERWTDDIRENPEEVQNTKGAQTGSQ